MLISHECPISLLQESRKWNDYSYALVHLFDKKPEYFEFFKEEVKNGRRVLLDNSIFELGTAFDMDEFAGWVQRLEPTEYVVPDCLQNAKQTMENFLAWEKKYRGIQGKKIGVVQGKTTAELIECYKFMAEHADKIAISFDYKWYSDEIGHPDKLTCFMLGRFSLINKLKNIGIHKPLHLLGASNPKEFSFYTKELYPFIESLDTSSPIVLTIFNREYDKEAGLKDKPTKKLADLIETPITEINLELLNKNIKIFRSFIRS